MGKMPRTGPMTKNDVCGDRRLQVKTCHLLTKCSPGERISGHADLVNQLGVVCPEITLSIGEMSLKGAFCQLKGLFFSACPLGKRHCLTGPVNWAGEGLCIFYSVMGPQREIASRWREYMGNVSASETKGRTGEIKCQVAPRPGL